MNNLSLDDLAKILWDYNNLNQPLKKSDAILVLGSNDIRVAQRGAELLLQEYAPLIIFSGGFGALTQNLYSKPEAEVFANEAIKMGVPQEKILIERHSTNTGQNIIFTKKLLEEKALKIASFIVIQKPYMLRRTYATFRKQWPGQDFVITSPQIGYEKYSNETISKDLLINIMVGDTQRIKVYPEKGFQIPQEIPEEVWLAFEELVGRGFTKHLIKES